MSHTIIKNAFKAIGYLCIFIAILSVVVVMTEISTLIRSQDSFFFNSEAFTIGSFQSTFWPKQILISLSVLILFIVLVSKKTEELIGSIKISGNILIPVLISIYVVVVVGYILSSNISYPSRLADEKVVPVIFLASGSLLFIPLLFHINNGLPRPSPNVTFATILVLMFGSSYWGLLTWAHYIVYGEIDIVYGFKALF